jgi:hypothetical protein
MLQLGNERKQRHRWDRMKRRGHLLELALNILIWVGSYGLVRLIHVVCFRFSWMHSPGTTSWEDVLIWTVTGIIVGELDWSNLKRKFRNLPPEEDWMTK